MLKIDDVSFAVTDDDEHKKRDKCDFFFSRNALIGLLIIAIK